MSDDLEAERNRVNISIKDLEEAHDYLNAYNNGLDVVIQRALLTAAIVAYSRPFKKNNPGSSTQSIHQISTLLEAPMDANQKTLHHKIIRLRDQGVAHSDFDRKPTQRVPSAPKSVMMWSRPFDVLSEDINVESFRDLAWKLKWCCVDRLFQINKEPQCPADSAGLPPGVQVENGAMAVTEGEVVLRIKLSDMSDIAPGA